MLVTISWIEENYNKFNNLYFDGCLPKVTFKISRAKCTWGYASYRYNYRQNTVTPESITISNYYDSPEYVKKTTLLHEMIHIFDYASNPHHFVKNNRKVRGYDAHGYWFKQQCERLKNFGWEIEKYVTQEEQECSSLSCRAAELEQNKIDQALLCVVVGSNGYNWMLKTNDSHVNILLNSITTISWRQTLGSVKDINFYRFSNPSLASRRSAGKSLRGWKYSNEMLLNRLEELHATEVHMQNINKFINKIPA